MTERASPLTGFAHALNAVVLVGIAGLALRTWGQLPDRIPSQFNFEGVPERWTEKGPELGMLFVVPWLVTGLHYALWASMKYFSRHPELTNLPPRLRALPPERVRPLFDSIRGVLLASATVVNLGLSAVFYGVFRVAVGAADRLPIWSILPFLVLIFAVLIGGVIHTALVMRRISAGA